MGAQQPTQRNAIPVSGMAAPSPCLGLLARRAAWSPHAGGADNCIHAAGILFFAFVGMEAPAIGAEEARSPADLPAAIVGNAAVAVLVYFVMSLSLVLMVPAAEVGTPAVPVSAAEYRANAFTAAFRAAGALARVLVVERRAWRDLQRVCSPSCTAALGSIRRSSPLLGCQAENPSLSLRRPPCRPGQLEQLRSGDRLAGNAHQRDHSKFLLHVGGVVFEV